MFLDEGECGGKSKSIRSQAEVSQSSCCSLSGFVPFWGLYLSWEAVAEKSPSVLALWLFLCSYCSYSSVQWKTTSEDFVVTKEVCQQHSIPKVVYGLLPHFPAHILELRHTVKVLMVTNY